MSHYSGSFNSNLTPEQRRLLNVYIAQYEQANSLIEHLLDQQDDIRSQINNILFTNTSRSSRNRQRQNVMNFSRVFDNFGFGNNPLPFNRNSRSTTNTNNRSRSNVYYDYDNPINPSLYTRLNNDNLFNFLTSFLNTTVQIRPTAEQIENATRNIRYRDISEPLTNRCPISLEEFTDEQNVRQIIHCGHIFCENAIQEWFQNNVRCPVCRYDIRDYRTLSRQNSRDATRNTTTTTTTTNTPETSSSTTEPISSNNDSTSSNTPLNVGTPSSNNLSNSIDNINMYHNPQTNQIDHISFDIANDQLTSDIISNVTSRLFQSLLFPSSNNNNNNRNNDLFMFDPSSNILLYETILRPSSSHNRQT